MGNKRVCFSQLCMLGEPEFVRREKGAWILDEVAVNKLYRAIANAGAEWQRIMPWGVWGKHPEGMKSQFSPYVLDGNKFDLRRFNDYYFPIVRKVIGIAKKYRIKTWWCLADNCQFNEPYRKWSSWATNVNGVYSVYDEKAQRFFRRWIKRCLIEFATLNVGWSWGNEINDLAFIETAKEVIFPFIKSGQFEPKNCTYGACMDSVPYMNGEYVGPHSIQDLLKKEVGAAFGDAVKEKIWREVHGVGGGWYPNPPNQLHQALTWWANHPIRIWLSDDGVFDGDSACDFEPETGRRRPSAKRWRDIVAQTKPYTNDFVFEHQPKGGNLKCQARTVKAIDGAI